MTNPREPFTLAGHDVAPGTRETITLPISTFSDHTDVSMTAHVIHGDRSGPTVFVCSGIHGDEITGIEVVRRVMKSQAVKNLSGTLILIPIVNTLGFINRSRYLPDRRDLNRSFPGRAGGSLASRLAHLFMTEIVNHADLGIDLHSAAVHRTNLPQVRVTPDNDTTLELAKVFGAPAIVTSTVREGSIRATAKDAGVDVLLYEAGEGLRFDEFSARVGTLGVLRVLNHLGMVSYVRSSPKKPSPLLCTDSSWVRSPRSGLLRSFALEGDVVTAGDELGIISDPLGTTETPVIADDNGLIIGRTACPIVHEGDALFHLADLNTSPEAVAKTLENLTSNITDHPYFQDDEIT